MSQITNSEELSAAIAALELQRAEQSAAIVNHIIEIQENLRPVNFIKNSVEDILHSAELKSGIVDFGLGIVSGYLAKRVAIGKTNSLWGNLVGEVIRLFVTKGVTDNASEIRSVGKSIINEWLNKDKSE